MGTVGTMFFYILIIFITTALVRTAYKCKNKRDKWLLIFLAVFILAFIAGIRFNVGSDFAQYYYDGVKLVGGEGYTGKKENYEIGYRLICKLIYLMGGNGSVLLFVYGFLTYLFLVLTLDRYRKEIDVSTAFFLYGCLYYLVSFNIMRQALAITIGMYAISHAQFELRNKPGAEKIGLIDLIKENMTCFIWCFIAMLFHWSGVICLLVLPISYFTTKKAVWRWSVLAAVCLAVINYRNFFKLAIWITGNHTYQWYFLADFGEKGSWIIYILRYLPHVLIVILAYRPMKRNKRMFTCFNLFCIGLIVNSLTVVTNTEIERLSFTYLYQQIIVEAYAVKNMNTSHCFGNLKVKFSPASYWLFKSLLVIFAIFIMWYTFIFKGMYGVVPYQTVFSE